MTKNNSILYKCIRYPEIQCEYLINKGIQQWDHPGIQVWSWLGSHLISTYGRGLKVFKKLQPIRWNNQASPLVLITLSKSSWEFSSSEKSLLFTVVAHLVTSLFSLFHVQKKWESLSTGSRPDWSAAERSSVWSLCETSRPLTSSPLLYPNSVSLTNVYTVYATLT